MPERCGRACSVSEQFRPSTASVDEIPAASAVAAAGIGEAGAVAAASSSRPVPLISRGCTVILYILLYMKNRVLSSSRCPPEGQSWQVFPFMPEYKTGMLPVASPPKCRQSCGSAPETDTLQKDFHNNSAATRRGHRCAGSGHENPVIPSWRAGARPPAGRARRSLCQRFRR